MNTRHINPRGGIVTVIVMAALSLAALACNLTAEDQNATPVAPPGIGATLLYPTATFILDTATPYKTPTITPSPVTPTRIPCVELAAWTTRYTVQPGDTLYQIALATGTTSEQLVIANCLDNADWIAAGDELRVPRLPVQPTATPLPTPTTTTSLYIPNPTADLTAEPFWYHPQSGQATTYYPSVRIKLDNVYSALRIDFYINDPQTGAATHIGDTDKDPWDGAFVDYTFPTYNPNGNNSYTFTAFITNDQITIQSNVFTIAYDPNFIPSEGRYDVLTIDPHREFDGAHYTLGAGDTVTIQWKNAPFDAVRIDFYTQPYNAAAAQIPRLIGSDLNPSDGSWMMWDVPTGLSGYIFAQATLQDQTTVDSQIMSVISE